jgi:predicted dithiol-disulfide oxidoreductase (DUF899 family)
MLDQVSKHQVVSREEWTAARKAHLLREKELTRLRDRVSAERRALPWVKVDKTYVFDGPNGKETLAQLFGPNSQLIVYHYQMTEASIGELPGLSVFYKDAAGEIFHTYSSYGRGGDLLIGAYNYLDLTPKGRNETTIMDWMRRHDEYEESDARSCCGADASRPAEQRRA